VLPNGARDLRAPFVFHPRLDSGDRCVAMRTPEQSQLWHQVWCGTDRRNTMGARYGIDQIDAVLDVLALDGLPTDRLLGLRRDVLAGVPDSISELEELAAQAGASGLLAGRS
jgi:hypothetical protein